MKYLLFAGLLFFNSCTLFLSNREIRIRECYKFIQAAQKKDYNKCKSLLRFGLDTKTKTEEDFLWDIDLIGQVWKPNDLPKESELIISMDLNTKWTTIRFPFQKLDVAQKKDPCKGYVEFDFDDYSWSNRIGPYFREIPSCWPLIIPKQKPQHTEYDCRYMGQLKRISKDPYIILACRDGYDKLDTNLAIYIRLINEQLKDSMEVTPNPCPGILRDKGTNRIISETRTFSGDCLPGKSDIVIWYQKQINKKGEYENSVFTIEVVNNKLIKTILKAPLPDIKETLEMLKQDKCKEMKGIDQTI